MALLTPDEAGPGAAIAGAIARALRGLRFGSVEITVHDGRVTLIERREKVRLEQNGHDDPIGHPKDPRGRHLDHDEKDPTGRPEVPLMERAPDATRNLEGSPGTFPFDVDDRPDDVARGAGGRSGSPGAAPGRGAGA